MQNISRLIVTLLMITIMGMTEKIFGSEPASACNPSDFRTFPLKPLSVGKLFIGKRVCLRPFQNTDSAREAMALIFTNKDQMKYLGGKLKLWRNSLYEQKI